MEKVAIAPCDTYSEEVAGEALSSVLTAIDGLSWVKSGMKIVIKANLVSFMKPEAAATTHPVLICELIKMLTERGAEVVVGDSPGGLYNSVFVNRVYSATGMKEVEKYGASLNQNFAQKYAKYDDAKILHDFQYTSYLDDADAIINFCKLKTHGMMGMSCATKNMFGVIPGTMKPEYHFRFPNPEDFARMIVDINEYFRPVLNIVDAVVGMEGNGPTAGTPRKIGAVLASKDPYSLDLVCADLIGLKKEDVPTLQAAFERNLVEKTVEDVDIIGDYKAFRIDNYEKISTPNSLLFRNDSTFFGRLTGNFLQKALDSHPQVKKKLCVGCRECYSICPAKAIEMQNKLPIIDRKKCIHCYCCQEFCPKGAMKVQRSFIARICNRGEK